MEKILFLKQRICTACHLNKIGLVYLWGSLVKINTVESLYAQLLPSTNPNHVLAFYTIKIQTSQIAHNTQCNVHYFVINKYYQKDISLAYIFWAFCDC